MNQRISDRDRDAARDIINLIRRTSEGVELRRVHEWAGDDTRQTQAAINYMLKQGIAVITRDNKLKLIQRDNVNG